MTGDINLVQWHGFKPASTGLNPPFCAVKCLYDDVHDRLTPYLEVG